MRSSCVSIPLCHLTRLIGEMYHFLLPSHPNEVGATLDGHYADEAMKVFLVGNRTEQTHPAKYGFMIDAVHMGGNGHRQFIFDIWSGHAWVRNPDMHNIS